MGLHKRYIMTEEHKGKISSALRGKPTWNKGKVGIYSKDILNKLSLARKGKTYEELFGKDRSNELKRNIRLKSSGRKHSEETKKILSVNHLGRIISQETREKLRNINLGKVSPMKGRTQTIESKMKNRLAHIGSTPWNKGKTNVYSKEALNKIVVARKKQITPVKDTSIEVKIQNFLKQLNVEFLTHQYMHIEHGYQCDILIPSKKCIIECFGDYWHKIPFGTEKDNLRCKELRELGYKVLVFWEKEIRPMQIEDFESKLIQCKII